MKNEKGFTLIELIIVLALLAIVLTIIFRPITFSLKNFNIQNEKADSISKARETMDYLTRQIRKADIVEVVDGNLIVQFVDDNDLIVDSKIYKLENRIIFEDENKIIEGIDELHISDKKIDELHISDEDKIYIEIIIKDNRDRDYKLSSYINLR